ncbi:MAG: spondin domain-containing protein, partial [Bacteroidota bacterium]
MKKLLLYVLTAPVVLASCGDDDGDEPDMVPDSPVTFEVVIDNVTTVSKFLSSGVFNTPSGATEAGPALPGSAYEFSFRAAPGMKLSFATMYVQSNDLFFAPDGNGIDLYPGGTALSGDITDQIELWDAGTEVNQEPGVGADQAPRQSGPNTGATENGTVELIANVNDGFTYPAVNSTIEATLTYMGDAEFRLTISNLGSSDSPLAPGVWVVHTEANPLFTEGAVDSGNGLEGVAEDGAATQLGDYAADNSGVVSPLAPGVFAVHSSAAQPLFTTGMADRGQGLEALAEDGAADELGSALTAMADVTASGVFNTPHGSSAPGPLMPGSHYEFTFTALPGQHLSFATMFVQSNDLFYSPGQT